VAEATHVSWSWFSRQAQLDVVRWEANVRSWPRLC